MIVLRLTQRWTLIVLMLTRTLVEWLQPKNNHSTDDRVNPGTSIGSTVVSTYEQSFDQRSCQPNNNHSTNGHVNLWTIIWPTVMSTKNNHSTNGRVNIIRIIRPTVVSTYEQSFDQRSCQPNNNHSTNGHVKVVTIIRKCVSFFMTPLVCSLIYYHFIMYIVRYTLIHLLYCVHESPYHVKDYPFTLCITYTQLRYKQKYNLQDNTITL
jgi:hypothetical protein